MKASATLILLSAILLSACQSGGTKPGHEQADHSGSCDFLPEQPAPKWVGGDAHIRGFYTGVGTVSAIAGESEAMAVAKQRAEADLAGGIATSVNSSLTSRLTTELRDDEESLSEDSEQLIRSVTNLSLENVQRAGRWLDRKSCILWVRVKVDNATIDRIKSKEINEQRLGRAEKLFSKANDASHSLDQRISDMEMAMALINATDFESLPLHSRSMFQQRYEDQLKHLHKQAGGREVVLIINAADKVPAKVVSELSSRFVGAVKGVVYKDDARCDNLNSCLMEARADRAKRLILADVTTSVDNGEMGSLLGNVKLSVGHYNVASGRALSQADGLVDQVLAFDLETMEWKLAVERLFARAKLNAVLEQARSCSANC